MRIAVLDDDPAQLEMIARALAEAGHACQTFDLAKPLVAALRRDTFDLLVLDWNLPDMSGVETIGWVRENLASPPPMLLLTSRSAEEDIVEGLEAGADDYVVKPVQPIVLRARIAALLRRAYPQAGAAAIETFGRYRFDPRTQEVDDGRGASVVLTPKEFSLALLLFRNTHRALSRSHILEAVWGRNPDLPTRTLDMHVSRIRTKLDLRPANGYRLVPVYSYGYRLEALEEQGASATEAAAI